MTAARFTHNFGAMHAKAVVVLHGNGVVVGSIKAWPTYKAGRGRIVFLVARKNDRTTRSAGVFASLIVMQQLAGARYFGTLLAQDMILLGGKFLLPLVV